MLLDWIKTRDLLKKNDFAIRSFMNPSKIALGLLKSPEGISVIVKSGLSDEYAKVVTDVWKPLPKGEDVKKKEYVQKMLPDLFRLIGDNLESLSLKPKMQARQVSYDVLKPHFDNLRESLIEGKERMEASALESSNPYLTVSIEDSYQAGEHFQVSAKIASSVETIWGNWIEKVVPLFNDKMFRVGAGGFDSILGEVAYDIKSGPNVMNKGLVEEAKAKREAISRLAKIKEFQGLISVKDFQVAITYGKEENAGSFMKNSFGMITFGADAWKTLTGDEWNAYNLFLWQIRYEIESGKKWTTDDLEKAVKQFINSFYCGDVKKLGMALDTKTFTEIHKMCVNSA